MSERHPLKAVRTPKPKTKEEEEEEEEDYSIQREITWENKVLSGTDKK